MPSRVIRPTEAPAPAPFTYTIGTAEGLAPEAVFAAWDGSGAFGDFLPCVSYYSAEGVLLDRAFPDGATLSPGDTAEVSYRPFRRGGAAPKPAAAPIYAEGTFVAFSNPPTAYGTLVSEASSGIPTVGGFWIIPKAGLYLCMIAGTTSYVAGNPPSAEIALLLAKTATGLPILGGFTMTPDAPPPFPAFIMNASATALRPLNAGDSIGVTLGAQFGATTIGTGGGRAGLYLLV